MKAKDIFGLAVRLIGLLFVCRALWSLPEVIGLMLAGGVGNVMMAILSVVCPFVVGVWFLRGAPLLADTAYPDTDEDSSNERQPFRPGGKSTDL